MHVLAFFLTFFNTICALNITLLHTNDFHGRFDEIDVDGFSCEEAERKRNACYGGLVRLASAVSAVRAKERNVILLDAGDRFAGSLWSQVYKGNATYIMTNYLNYTAMTLGNHDFDYGISNLQHFLERAMCDTVVSNINTSNEPNWQNNKQLIKDNLIIDVGGEKIGIVGYIITSTPRTSNSGSNIEFLPILQSVQKAVNDLESKGVTKIIAVGHAGFDVDKEIAKKVKGVDIVVGGHSNTFLYTGDPPSTEKAKGIYPFIVHPEHNKTLSVPVVQAYMYSKYLGYLKIKFDDQGHVTNYHGNPILLDHSIVADVKVKKVIDKMKEFVDQKGNVIIGQSKVSLTGSRSICSTQPCQLGKVMAAAMVYHFRSYNVTIGLLNGGSIRVPLPTDSEGNIYYKDLFSSFPYFNTVDLVELSGEDIISSLASSGGLQVQGLRVKYKSLQPARVVGSVDVQQLSCPSSKACYERIRNGRIYMVAINSYLITGGNHFLTTKAMNRHRGGSIYDVIVEYLRDNSPISDENETNFSLRLKHDLVLTCNIMVTLWFAAVFLGMVG